MLRSNSDSIDGMYKIGNHKCFTPSKYRLPCPYTHLRLSLAL
jgi:hypothetical protein